MAGITCAQRVQQAGYRVAVIEKSKGLGGRVATRRLSGTCADHGLRYLEPQGEQTATLIQSLLQTGVLTFWTDQIYEWSGNQIIPAGEPYPRYAAPDGMTTIAKAAATGLTIYRGQRVLAVIPTPQGWRFTLDPIAAPASDLLAKAIVLAIPAPQAFNLLEPLASQGLSSEILAKLRSVEFDPCITAIAVYASEHEAEIAVTPWQAVRCTHDPAVTWIGQESSKRRKAEQPVIVSHSTADFAKRYLESEDLQAVGQQLLDRAAAISFPWLSRPQILQVHRWRYAFVKQALPELYLASLFPLHLVCSGEWCGGYQIEAALQSGQAAAMQIMQAMVT